MKKIVVLILACIVLSLTAFADKKPKKSNEDGQGADITTVVLPPTDKDILDSLQQSADSLLKLLGNRKELVIPNLDMFMVWLMNSDTVDSDHDIMIRFGEMVIDDIRFLRLQNDNDSVYRQFVSYHEASKIISNIQQILSCSYDENKIGCLEHQLGKLEKNKLTLRQREQLDYLTKGVKYYKNKISFRRVGDIINELYELKSDSTLNGDSVYQIRDSIFGEIINHQGRNYLINYVPYTVKLRQKVVDSFSYDDCGHVLFDSAKWDIIEKINEEIELTLKK